MNPGNQIDTIVAPATAPGIGALTIIRLSGSKALDIASSVFASKTLKPRNLVKEKPNTIHFGVIHDDNTIVDEVLVSLFKAPHSFTGEDTVEISCHGSAFIKQEVLQLLVRKGARMAHPGEFTERAFLNGKMDLSQAEAVADLISSHSDSSHKIALNQMRGGFSGELKKLREELIHFASLLELELDFSEEDVEFANRSDLRLLMEKLHHSLNKLIDSFSRGNVLKTGVPVAIIGRPNAGKSTLLNVLLNEERAIVSEIAGTTRDTVEDEININGVSFRFIDTAGIRETTDTIENIGVQRAFQKAAQAKIIIYLFDVNAVSEVEIQHDLEQLRNKASDQVLILKVANKIELKDGFSHSDVLKISAKNKEVAPLLQQLSEVAEGLKINEEEVVITNVRHYESLQKTDEMLLAALGGLNSGLSSDLIAMNIRQALYYLGEITGEISSMDLLKNIFGKFCIGK